MFNFGVKFMKLFLSLVAVVSISLGSMQVAVANVSEKTGVHKSNVSVDKALSHVEINPFVDRKRADKNERAKTEAKITDKKRFTREGHVVKYKSVV